MGVGISTRKEPHISFPLIMVVGGLVFRNPNHSEPPIKGYLKSENHDARPRQQVGMLLVDVVHSLANADFAKESAAKRLSIVGGHSSVPK